MSMRSCGQLIVCGAGLTLLAGCHMYARGPGYYNAGPMYGPTYSAPPAQYMTPGPVYTPQNMTPAPYSSPSLGSPTPISPTPSQSTPTWRPDPNNGLDDAPPFKSNNNGVVPTPLDPDFDPLPGGAAAIPKASPIATVGATDGAPAMFPGNEPDPFESPVPVQASSNESAMRPIGLGTESTTPQDPYGYDGENYSYVKGIVDYDAASKTWSIIYELKPDIGDRFGGSFIFAPHPQLDNMRPGDIVLAKGRVDPGRTDTRGKPLYEISSLVVLGQPVSQ